MLKTSPNVTRSAASASGSCWPHIDGNTAATAAAANDAFFPPKVSVSRATASTVPTDKSTTTTSVPPDVAAATIGASGAYSAVAAACAPVPRT